MTQQKMLINSYNTPNNAYSPINSHLAPSLTFECPGEFSLAMKQALEEKLLKDDQLMKLSISQLYTELFNVFKQGHPDGGIIIQKIEQLRLRLMVNGPAPILPIDGTKTIREFAQTKQMSLQQNRGRLLIAIGYECEPVKKLKTLLETLKEQLIRELPENVFTRALDGQHNGTGVPVYKELKALIPLIPRYYNETPGKNNISILNPVNKIPSLMAVFSGQKKDDIFTGVWSSGWIKPGVDDIVSIQYTYSDNIKNTIQSIVEVINSLSTKVDNVENKTNASEGGLFSISTKQASTANKKKISNAFFCPITHKIMKKPVICVDGYSYEKEAIVDWLSKNNKSPVTNEPMSMELAPIKNRALVTLIKEFKQDNPELFDNSSLTM